MPSPDNCENLPHHIIDTDGGTTEIFLYAENFQPVRPLPVHCHAWVGIYYAGWMVSKYRNSTRKADSIWKEIEKQTIQYSKLHCNTLRIQTIRNAIHNNWQYMSTGKKVFAETMQKDHGGGIISYVFDTPKVKKAKSGKNG